VGTLAHLGLATAWRTTLADYGDRLVDAATRMAIAVEAGLEAIDDLIQEQVNANDYDDETREELRTVRNEAAWCIEESLRRCEAELLTHKALAIEADFELRMGALLYGGTIDLVTQSPDGEIIVWDHKTTRFAHEVWDHRLQLDTQFVGYSHATERGVVPGVPPGAVTFRWSVVRSKPPSTPHLNKDGSFSVAAIETTPEIYADALADQEMRGIPVSDKQRLLLQKLRGAGDRWYTRVDTHVTAEQHRRWLEELKVTAKRMRSAIKRPEERTRTPEACSSPSSGRCSYRDVCIQPEPEIRAFYGRSDSGGRDVTGADINGSKKSQGAEDE
jgi:hypothetical protein